MHVIGHRMPLNQLNPQLGAEVPQDLPDILAERAKDCFLPIFRYDNDVVPAIPPDVALTLPLLHGGFSSSWPWRAQEGRNHLSPHESTPERQSLFESHRQRRWLTRWNYWEQLAEGGNIQAQQCGWLKDKYGMSWQVVPTVLIAMLNDPDTAKSQRVMAAMLPMKKIDIATLKRAYTG
jgi:hypothetical protein